MKECPVCSESFPNELRFCDIDGTRLIRKGDGGEPRGRLWSLLGAGLLVGALVITGATIFFFPKTRNTPAAPITTSSGSVTPPRATTPSETAEKAASTEVAEQAPSRDDLKPAGAARTLPDGSTVQPKRKDANQSETTDETAGADSNPKAAPKPDQSDEKPDHTAGGNKTAEPAPVKAGPSDSAAARPSNPAPAKETASKNDASTADPKKDPKRAAKSGDKYPNSNKKDEKKGGFFRVFKKIFGKN